MIPYELRSESDYKCYLEANESYIKEGFAIAEQHKHIYLSMIDHHFNLYQNVFDYIEKTKGLDAVVYFLLNHTPDCNKRALLLRYYYDKMNENEK